MIPRQSDLLDTGTMRSSSLGSLVTLVCDTSCGYPRGSRTYSVDRSASTTRHHHEYPTADWHPSAGSFGLLHTLVWDNIFYKGLETVNVQVVKSDSATVSVPELEFEIPANTQKGSISTVEGLLSEAATGLRTHQA